MYSYQGQGSPAVVSYQYGTERYVRDDKYSGLDIQNFDPRPTPHQQPQNDPRLHRQNIEKSGMMPMQRGQANLFPHNGKGLSYASSNLDSYEIVDKHSSTSGFTPLASMDYLRNNDDDRQQVYMQSHLGKYKDFQVKRYRYRLYENGLIQIMKPSPTMVGRLISPSKRPQLYNAIIDSIVETYNIKSSSDLSGIRDVFKNLRSKVKDIFTGKEEEQVSVQDYIFKHQIDVQSDPTLFPIIPTLLPDQTQDQNGGKKGINNLLILGGILGGGFLFYKFVLKK